MLELMNRDETEGRVAITPYRSSLYRKCVKDRTRRSIAASYPGMVIVCLKCVVEKSSRLELQLPRKACFTQAYNPPKRAGGVACRKPEIDDLVISCKECRKPTEVDGRPLQKVCS